MELWVTKSFLHSRKHLPFMLLRIITKYLYINYVKGMKMQIQYYTVWLLPMEALYSLDKWRLALQLRPFHGENCRSSFAVQFQSAQHLLVSIDITAKFLGVIEDIEIIHKYTQNYLISCREMLHLFFNSMVFEFVIFLIIENLW